MQLNLKYLPSVGWSDQIDVDTSKVVPCSPISLFVFCSGIIPSKKTSWKIQNAKHKMENTKSKKQNPKLKIQSEKYKMQNAKSKIQNKNVEFKLQNAKCLALFARHNIRSHFCIKPRSSASPGRPWGQSLCLVSRPQRREGEEGGLKKPSWKPPLEYNTEISVLSFIVRCLLWTFINRSPRVHFKSGYTTVLFCWQPN